MWRDKGSTAREPYLDGIWVDVSKVVSDICLILQSAAFRCLPFSADFICLFVVSVLLHFSNRN